MQEWLDSSKVAAFSQCEHDDGLHEFREAVEYAMRINRQIVLWRVPNRELGPIPPLLQGYRYLTIVEGDRELLQQTIDGLVEVLEDEEFARTRIWE